MKTNLLNTFNSFNKNNKFDKIVNNLILKIIINKII